MSKILSCGNRRYRYVIVCRLFSENLADFADSQINSHVKQSFLRHVDKSRGAVYEAASATLVIFLVEFS
jgi:hypothetical protein